MTATVWPANAVSGAPSYGGKQLRRALGSLWSKATTRPMGALSGIHPATPANYITVTATTWTLAAPLTGVVDTQASAIEGPYCFAFDATSETGAVNAADATNQRVDSICVQLSDPDAGDGTPTPSVTLVYTAGIPGASGGARGAAGGPPNVPARSFEIGQIVVPASGGGSPVYNSVAPKAVAAGGILPAASSAGYPASPYVGQYVDDAAVGLMRSSTGGWFGVAPRQRQTGVKSVTLATGSASVSGTVTFPVAFAAAPAVFLQIQNDIGTISVNVTATSTTGFSFKAFVTTGANAAADHPLNIAWEASV